MPPTTANGSSVKGDTAGGGTADETKTVKPSDSDKAKARAERFGTSSADLDEKKAARAARFGIQNTSQKIGKICFQRRCLYYIGSLSVRPLVESYPTLCMFF